jgi:hypothetical protein
MQEVIVIIWDLCWGVAETGLDWWRDHKKKKSEKKSRQKSGEGKQYLGREMSKTSKKGFIERCKI